MNFLRSGSNSESDTTRRRITTPKILLSLLALAGPGLIAANAGNDAGGIATYASAGAQFGYSTLFLMLLVTIALVIVQEMCARIGAYTGDGLGSLLREHFSIKKTTFALAALVIANTGLVVSEFAGIAAALSLFHVSRFISIPVAALGVWSLVMFGTYKRAEQLFLVLSLAFFTYPVAMILSHPNYQAVATNLFTPHFILTKNYLFLGVALIGTTITPYMQFYLAGAVADKGIGPDDYHQEKVGTISGTIIAEIISMVIIIATAAAISTRAPLTSAADAARALKPVAGQFAGELFGIGLLGASALAAAIVPLSTSYAVSEAIGSERSVGKRFHEAPIFTGLFTGQILIGALIALIPSNLINTLINTQILNGIIAPIILTFILIIANNKSIMGEAANGRIFKLAAIICVAVIGVLSLFTTIMTIAGWLGINI
ncbi:MAG TPA: divalent metal cation transporter [Candidatus Saccharimonadales bacterium]|nr:divalent metal cation transporter [Candidatus Saccharimonadales bacterium]